MDCPQGCELADRPQTMRERDAGWYVCPQCQHEIREHEDNFSCTCEKCRQAGIQESAKALRSEPRLTPAQKHGRVRWDKKPKIAMHL